MNRLKSLLITLLLILVFTGCEGNSVKDTTLPSFETMVNKTIPYGTTLDPMTDIRANDNIDGDITASVECIIYDSYGNEAFDVKITDIYRQMCTVSDSSGNTATKERTITVQDELIGAVISGVEDTTVGIGKYFDPMANLEIIDKLDGNITNEVVINIYYEDPLEIQVGSVDTSILRTYYIDYIIINSLNITSQLRITVDVVDDVGPVIEATDIETNNYMLINLLDEVTATDNIYGDISEITYTLYDSSNNEVEYVGNVYGEFTLRYEAIDPLGNVGSKEVSIIITDIYPPEITLQKYILEILPGDVLNIEENFTYSDTSDDNLIMNYQITNMDTEAIIEDLSDTDYGFYEVRVTVTDEGEQRDQKSFYLNITTGDMIPVELNITSATQDLNIFFEDLRGNYYTDEQFCGLYFTNLAFDVNMTYQECMSGRNNIDTKTTRQTILTTRTEVIEGITYYTTEVEFYRPDEHVFKDITYHIVQYEYSWLTHIVFDTDPFEVEYPISVYQPDFELVDNQLISFYNMMLLPSYQVPTFCDRFVINAAYNTMTSSECIEIVETLRDSIIRYSVDSYKAISIPFNGEIIDGYEADISISRTSLEETVTVQFIFFQQGDNQSMLFIDGFFGEDYNYNLKFTEGDSYIRETKISEFYDGLINDTLTPTEFCEAYYLISPVYDFDLTHCLTYVEDIRSQGISYTINSITPTNIDAFNGSLNAYTLDITFLDDGIDQNLLIDFVLLDKPEGIYPVFFDLYLVNLNYEEELKHAVVGYKVYPAILQGFYTDVMNTSMSNTDFFHKYLLTGGAENTPLTSEESSTIRTDLLKGTYSYVIEDMIYQNLNDPEYPPVYLVNVKRNNIRTYKVEFTMYYNPLGELIIRVNLNEALGGGFE